MLESMFWTCVSLPVKRFPGLKSALNACRQSDDKVAEGCHLGNLGLAYSDLGEPRKAIEFYEQALKISREIGDRQGEGNRLGNLGTAYSHLGEPRKAIEFYEQALKISVRSATGGAKEPPGQPGAGLL